jgi:hypothetical protein
MGTSTFLPKIAKFGTMFEYTQFHSIVMTWVPYVASTVSGSMAVGLDPLPTAGEPAATSDAARHAYSFVSDLKQQTTLVIPGSALHQAEGPYGPWLINSSSTTSVQWYCAGVLQIYGNTSTTGVIGHFQVDVDVSFRALTAT